MARVSLTKLHAAPWNPRSIRDERFKNLCRSLEADPEFMALRPVLATKAGLIYAGNMRFRAAQHLGWTEIEAHLTDIPEQLAKERALRDNAGWGENVDESLSTLLAELKDAGSDIDLLGFDSPELDRLLAGVTQVPEEDEADLEPPVEPITKPGDLWLMGEHRLLCGDSFDRLNVARLLNGEQIACTFTSPPYAVGLDYGATYEDSIENLRSMLPLLAEIAFEHTVHGGFLVVNFGDIVAGRDVVEVDDVCEYPMAVEYWPTFRGAGWMLYTRRIWAKPHARVHSPWAIQSCRAASDWEHLWTWVKPGAKAITARGEYSAFGVWDTSKEHGVDVGKEVHGAGFAVAIVTRTLETHSRRSDVVWEPFAGTGTTVIGAEQLGRHCYASEISPGYCDVIVNRWAKLTGKIAVLETANVPALVST